MELNNILMVITHVVSLFIVLVGLSFLLKMVFKAWDINYPCKRINLWLLCSMVIVSIWQVTKSPITRPTNDVHDKAVEVSQLKREYQEIKLPDLKDNSRKEEVEDLSETPLLDEALK